jgi:hypothetical protein
MRATSSSSAAALSQPDQDILIVFMKPKALTIGLLTYDDFDGLYFTVQSIRMFHPEALDDIEFLILDNHPDSAHGAAVKRFCSWIREPVRYVPVTDARGTALRDRLFGQARTEAVLCLDSHVLLAPGALRRLIDFFQAGEDDGNLLQGPLLYDDQRQCCTHFDPVWRNHMWGIWATDERGRDPAGAPFEIPAQGLGVFACRGPAWPGFNPGFRGFGGEECYIHEKFRRRGKKTLCLPFLRWLHRFERPGGVPYPLRLSDRVHNYLLGHAELGLDPEPVRAHFRGSLSAADWRLVEDGIDLATSNLLA